VEREKCYANGSKGVAGVAVWRDSCALVTVKPIQKKHSTPFKNCPQKEGLRFGCLGPNGFYMPDLGERRLNRLVNTKEERNIVA